MEGPPSAPGPRYDYSSGIPKLVEPEAEPAPAPAVPAAPPSALVRMAIAGAFLIFCGVMNLLAGLAAAFAAVVFASSDPESLLRLMERREPEQAEALRARLKKENASIDDVHRAYLNMSLFFAAGGVSAGLMGLFGGRALQTGGNYGLAMAGAVVNALPCLSPCGCAMIGPFFGVWCVLVLLQEETWQAFGRSRSW
ncbi:MAG: hypothetical protein KJS91_05115 [Planctomycetes bacterium]|nr:hypothetical protein [Planctomycetota bacterium]